MIDRLLLKGALTVTQVAGMDDFADCQAAAEHSLCALARFPALEMFRHQSHLAVDIGRQRFAGVLRVAGDIERRCIRAGRREHILKTRRENESSRADIIPR